MTDGTSLDGLISFNKKNNGTNHHYLHFATMNSSKVVRLLILSAIVFLQIQSCHSLSSSSSFHGMQIINPTTTYHASTYTKPHGRSSNNVLVMRKQKASDKRTARMKRGVIDNVETTTFTPPSLLSSSSSSTRTQILNSSPMTKSKWKHKKVELRAAGEQGSGNNNNMGRGRARKRLKLYNSLASYHSTFLELISQEYQMEVCCVVTCDMFCFTIHFYVPPIETYYLSPFIYNHNTPYNSCIKGSGGYQQTRVIDC